MKIIYHIPTEQSFGERMRCYRVKHGQWKYNDPTYYTWVRMRNRCLSPRSKDYKNYGGRGIAICKEWEDYAQFLADMGSKPSKKHSLDRIDNNGNYSKENCRWTTWDVQENNRRDNKFLTHLGETLTQAQWCRKLGIRPDTLSWRLKNGWDTTRALTPTT